MTNENLTPVLISGVSCYEENGVTYLVHSSNVVLRH